MSIDITSQLEECRQLGCYLDLAVVLQHLHPFACVQCVSACAVCICACLCVRAVCVLCGLLLYSGKICMHGCMCTYICMYVHQFVYMYEYVYIYIYIYICMDVCMYVHIFVYNVYMYILVQFKALSTALMQTYFDSVNFLIMRFTLFWLGKRCCFFTCCLATTSHVRKTTTPFRI